MGGVQELKDGEYHIDKILKKVTRKKRHLYEVAWKGYEQHTLEPRENIPRILVELFERYGDSTLPTVIQEKCIVDGVKYINVYVNGDVITLPHSSLVLDPNAYFVKPIKDEENISCDTIKTKSRFYQRTGGILVMAKPCGTIVAIAEIFVGESVSQVAEVIEHFLKTTNTKTKCLIYDDACHLRCRCEMQMDV